MALRMALSKIWGNRGLMACLLVGMVLSSALVSLIPMYARASLQHTFIEELERYQQEEGVYPGTMLGSAFFNDNPQLEVIRELKSQGRPALQDERVLAMLRERADNLRQLAGWMDGLPERTGLDVQARVYNLATMALRMQVEGGRSASQVGKLQSLSGLSDNCTLLRGRLPQPGRADGVLEALATEQALIHLGAEVGQTLSCVPTLDESAQPLRVLVVGTFDLNPDKPYAWSFFKPAGFGDSLLLPEEDLAGMLEREPMLVASGRFHYAFDYRGMVAGGLAGYVELERQANRELAAWGGTLQVPALAKAAGFRAQERSLTTTLWVLNIPVLVMLALYMTMISGMVVAADASEIALIASRGGSRLLIGRMYLAVGLVLSLGALALGPPLGALLCRVLGASNGFLSFVNRATLPVSLTLEGYAYSLAALAVSVLALVAPAMRQAGHSIVEQKRVSARRRAPLWQRLFLDVALLAASLGLYELLTTQPQWAKAADGQLSPMVFILMPGFVLGGALCFLRVYPLLVRGVYALGRRLWRPPAYLALTRVARTLGSYQYVMVFLTLTVAVGLFSASAARTLNDNQIESLQYHTGADVVLTVSWPRSTASGEQASLSRRVQEPSFEPTRTLAGVEAAARVFRRDGVQASAAGSASGVHLMAIDPPDFGRVAGLRAGLLPVHLNYYLNALSNNPQGVLVSPLLLKALGLEQGGWLELSWEGGGRSAFQVVGVVNYFPGWEPLSEAGGNPYLAVANLNTVQALLGIEPYQSWLKLRAGASSQALYDDIRAKKLQVTAIDDFIQKNLERVTSSAQLSVNGAMTLGFLTSCLVCALGFMLFWQMYLRRNQLQLGLERGMGLTVGQLAGMLVWEQALTCGAALLCGVGLGLAGSLLFVPLFENAGAVQTPPFRVRMLRRDRLVLYGLFTGLLALCWGYLALKVARMKVAQAIKLGED